MQFFRREGRDPVSPDSFIDFVGLYLQQAPTLDLPELTGDDLHSAVLSEKATSGGLDGWTWHELKALPLSWYVGLALILREVENSAAWPQRLLDAYITIILKTYGDSTPLLQRPFVFYRLFIASGPRSGLAIFKLGFTLGSQTLFLVLVKVYQALMHGMRLPWILRRCLVGHMTLMFTFSSLMSLNPSILLIEGS